MSVTETTGDVLSGSSQQVPSWLANLSAVSWRLVAAGLLAFVVLWMVGVFWIVFASVVLAALISAVFAPTMLRLRDRGYSANKAALMVFGLALGVIALIVAVVVIALLPFLVDLVRALASGVDQVKTWFQQANLSDSAASAVQSALSAVLAHVNGPIGGAVAQIASTATIVLLAIFLVFFFVRDGDKAWLWIFQNVKGAELDNVTDAGRQALDRVANYVRGTSVLALFAAATTWLFMFVLGLPLALPSALIVFVAGFIPYFGPPIATLIVILIALASGSPVTAALLLALIVARGLIIHFLFEPQLYRHRANLHPALVLIALTVGFQLAGIVGAVVAVPITAALLSGYQAFLQILEPEATPGLPTLVPGWLDTIGQYSVRLLIVIALGAMAIAVVVTVPLVIIPIVGALILAATLDPIVVGLVARGWSRTLASAVSIGGGIFSIAAILVLAIVALPGDASGIANAVSGGASSVSGSAGGQLDLAVGVTQSLSLSMIQTVASAFTAVVGITIVAAISALLGFFFLRDGGAIWMHATDRFKVGTATEVRGAGQRAFDALGGYMLGTAAISFVGAASQWLIMVLLGLPYALPVFVLSFILCFIPYFGGYISTGIAFLITVQYGTPLAIAFMFAWTMVFNIVQGNVLAPVVYGRTVHIHPAIVLLAVPAGAAVAGVAGMFLAVPVAGVIAGTWRSVLKVIGDRISSGESAVSHAIDDEPVPAPTAIEGEALAPG